MKLNMDFDRCPVNILGARFLRALCRLEFKDE